MTGTDGDSGRIRVLWVSKGLGPGGAERLLVSFARSGDHSRFSFGAAYLLAEKSQLAASLRSAGTETICLAVSSIGDLRWLWRLRRVLVERRIHVIHLHSPLVGALVRAVAMTVRPRPRLVSTAHNVWPSFHPATRALDRLTARLDHHTFAVSASVRDSLPPRMRNRSEVLVHGVDVAEISRRRGERRARRSELGLTDRRAVITVANLRADKDYPNLFAAAERVLAEHPDVVFLAIGQGPLEEQLRRDLAGRALGDRFRMLGHQEDPVGHLVAADVFTLASRHEGLPVSLLEGIAAGLPAAVTAVGGMPEVVTHGVEGRVVPPGDPAALAHAIIELLVPAANARARAAALQRATDFDVAGAVHRQQAVYHQLAAGSR